MGITVLQGNKAPRKEELHRESRGSSCTIRLVSYLASMPRSIPAMDRRKLDGNKLGKNEMNEQKKIKGQLWSGNQFKHQILNEMNSKTCILICDFTSRFAFYFQKGCLHLGFFFPLSHSVPSLHLL